jgi:hypothetical protein
MGFDDSIFEILKKRLSGHFGMFSRKSYIKIVLIYLLWFHSEAWAIC